MRIQLSNIVQFSKLQNGAKLNFSEVNKKAQPDRFPENLGECMFRTMAIINKNHQHKFFLSIITINFL